MVFTFGEIQVEGRPFWRSFSWRCSFVMGAIHPAETSNFRDVHSVSHGKNLRPSLLQEDHRMKSGMTEKSTRPQSDGAESLHKLNHGKNADTDQDPQYSVARHPCHHGQHTTDAFNLLQSLLYGFDQVVGR